MVATRFLNGHLSQCDCGRQLRALGLIIMNDVHLCPSFKRLSVVHAPSKQPSNRTSSDSIACIKAARRREPLRKRITCSEHHRPL